MAFYVISYDISKTKTRNKVAKLLEGYGRRIQYSVFECEIEEASYASLYEKLLKQTLESGTDSIRIYRLCKKCAGKVKIKIFQEIVRRLKRNCKAYVEI